MDLAKIAQFFTVEAVATYIVALGTLAFWIYQARKSKQGRHVVCIQSEPPFSHLRLSDRARQWVIVEYVGQHPRMSIDALSQVVIDIKNDSDTDVLNDVSLKFRVPDASVVDVWWEAGPDYITEHSKLDFSPEDDSSPETWEVQVFIPHLKAFKKYGEVFTIGILADGDLGTIEMPSQGSTRSVPWTAKFISFDDLWRKQGLMARFRYYFWLIVMLIGLSSFLWLTSRMLDLAWPEFVIGTLIGYTSAGMAGYLSQKAQFEFAMRPKDS